MASVTLASPYLKTNTINPKDDSFSSYLNLVRESFSTEPIYSCRTTRSSLINSSRRHTTDDGEIDIFSAEKYFNGAMDYNKDHMTSNNETKPSNKKEGKRSTKSRSKKSTSTSSEVSSNSRTGLIKQTNTSKKSDGKKFLGVFPCSCVGKHAVDTDGEIRSQEGSFDHKIMEEKRMRMERIGLGFKEGLLTYRPNSNPKGVLTREIKSEERNNLHNNFNENYDDEDIGSECSSDLFEIKSLSIKSHPFFETDEADESAVYEPSEASIEWSVVTASAANFSVASDSDEKRTKSERHNHAGLLTGCVSHRAVDVTDDLVKINRENIPMKINQARPIRAPLMRYQMERRDNTDVISSVQTRKHVYIH